MTPRSSSRCASRSVSAASRPAPVRGGPRRGGATTRASSAARGSRSSAVSDLEIPGPARADRGPALRARRARATRRRSIVYYHGGGHVICDLDTHDQPCRFLAREIARAGALGRLPPRPRASVPGGGRRLRFAAFRWAAAEAARLGADPERIAVAGDSAGGNLAAVVAQLARADGGPAPAFQALIYPVTDYSVKRPVLRRPSARASSSPARRWTGFATTTSPSEADRSDPRASPILADGPRRAWRPAHVVTAGFDPLRDEGEDYAERAARGGRADDPAPRARPRPRLHQRRRPRRPRGRGLRRRSPRRSAPAWRPSRRSSPGR